MSWENGGKIICDACVSEMVKSKTEKQQGLVQTECVTILSVDATLGQESVRLIPGRSFCRFSFLCLSGIGRPLEVV